MNRREFFSFAAVAPVAVPRIVTGAEADKVLSVDELIDRAFANCGVEERKWKRAFIDEFCKGVDMNSAGDEEIAEWLVDEANNAFASLDDPSAVDPTEEASEWIYALAVSQ